MSDQNIENLSQEFADLLSHRSMRQFALAIKQRRTLERQPLQFARALQTKYFIDEETEPSPATVRGFVQKIGVRSWMPRRSLQARPLKFAKATPIEIAAQPELAATKSSNRPTNEVKQLESKVNQSNFQILESSVQTFLSNILNIRIPGIRIYANSLSDSLVQKYHADALTYPDKILFRIGKYDPRKITGLALLGHELTHLEQFKRQDALSMSEDCAIAETEALTNERKVFRYISAPQGYPEPTNSLGSIADADRFTDSSLRTHPSIPQARDNPQSLPIPKAALSEREIGLSPPVPLSMNRATPLSELQLNAIKDEVYRDLRQRLRTEFERGS
jgi:Domain of unknown function (DUF4157)